MPIAISRRRLVAGFVIALASPLSALAQGARKIPRIGVLLAGTPDSFSIRAKALVEGLEALGYVDGKTVTIDWKWGEDRPEKLPELAAALAALNPDVIVTAGTPAAKSLKNATRTIPIVMAIIGDPVAANLVDSLARPGGNATGFSIVAPELSGKRLQLFREIIPDLSSVAALSNAANPQSQVELKEMRAAAQSLNLQLHPIQISTDASLDNAFAAIQKEAIGALIVLTDAILYSERGRILALAQQSRLPGMYFFREFVVEGGLMSYAPSDTDLFRRCASYVDRILKGARPGDLPVQQPTKFELVINLKTAKALGLSVPQELLATADEVIE
jgi:putative tryptophan/tyrosine transport system substrate-binding protein